MFRYLPKYLLFISCLVISISSCKKDELLTDASAMLEFSESKILFDTVFVQTGSATQVFLVYNRNDRPVRISSLRLATGNASYFRLNVNGTPGRIFSNVEIGAKDSLFIFVEVTIPDPNSPNTPFIVTDSILFDLNGNHQQVSLVAWGQRAHFHHAPVNSGSLFFLPHNDMWVNDSLPHVIYGYGLVDEGYTLTIEQGVRVHFHPGSGLIVLSNATLKVNGTLASPVTFQGDRLGDAFKDIPGQWDRIWFSNLTHSNLVNGTNEIGPGSVNSSINYAIIKNGNIGLHVDTVNTPGATTLRIDNTIIKNMSGVALLAQGSGVKANNCVFANCGQYLAAILYGGNHRFLHCTFANYWSQATRQTPSIFINNYYNGVRPIDSAYFGNCIIYGNLETEIELDSSYFTTPGTFNFMFDHCLLKVDNTISTTSPLHYNAIITGQDPAFDDITNNNYKISASSMAVNAGAISITNLSPFLNFDLKGDVRPQGTGPDLGAYEKQ